MKQFDLLSCPFCGKKPQVYHRKPETRENKTGENLWYVQCNNCKARSPMVKNCKTVAKAMWDAMFRELDGVMEEMKEYGIRV